MNAHTFGLGIIDLSFAGLVLAFMWGWITMVRSCWLPDEGKKESLQNVFNEMIKKSHRVSLFDFCIRANCNAHKGKRFLRRRVREHQGIWVDESHDCVAVFRDEIQNALSQGAAE